jgi:tRNA-specific 2-thiouridylase
MLQEQGYEVVGVTMRTWDVASHFTPGNDQPNEVIEAQELAARLGIEHHVADVRTEFRQVIVQYFIDEYMRGRTPNPCVMCNPLFKERILCEWADKCNCAWIATGHYCQLKDLNGYRYILTGDDPLKDQSYFLWKLPQEILKRMMFPLGGMTKASVRDYLASKGFEAKARGGESMEICFIEKDYREFLKEHCPDIDERIGPGWFVDSKGLKLGQHKGFAYYTIGQRKGLEIALGKPAYVLKINPAKNTVMLGDADQLKTYYMLVEDYNVTSLEELLNCKELSVRIRYRSRSIPCRVILLDNGQLLIRFEQEASAITPGQSAVFYEGNRVLGGGFIASQQAIKKIAAENEAKFLWHTTKKCPDCSLKPSGHFSFITTFLQIIPYPVPARNARGHHIVPAVSAFLPSTRQPLPHTPSVHTDCAFRAGLPASRTIPMYQCHYRNESVYNGLYALHNGVSPCALPGIHRNDSTKPCASLSGVHLSATARNLLPQSP